MKEAMHVAVVISLSISCGADGFLKNKNCLLKVQRKQSVQNSNSSSISKKMSKFSTCCNSLSQPTLLQYSTKFSLRNSTPESVKHSRERALKSFASKAGGLSLNSILKKCERCGGQGAIECPGCKGTGKNKKNGNIFERWKCFDCQGFGLKSCPVCGKGGLTPEQRGER